MKKFSEVKNGDKIYSINNETLDVFIQSVAETKLSKSGGVKIKMNPGLLCIPDGDTILYEYGNRVYYADGTIFRLTLMGMEKVFRNQESLARRKTDAIGVALIRVNQSLIQ